VSGYWSIVIALITLVGGALVYVWQRSADRKERVREERQIVYLDYLKSIRKLLCIFPINIEDSCERNALREAILVHEDYFDVLEIYASDTVIAAALQFEANFDEITRVIMEGGSFEETQEIVEELFSKRHEIVETMRSEVFSFRYRAASDTLSKINSIRGSSSVLRRSLLSRQGVDWKAVAALRGSEVEKKK
jgi:hypothetical protein